MAVAALWMAGAIASFSLLAVAGREVSTELDTFEIMFFRSGMGAVIVTATLAIRGRLREARPRRFPLHVARNLIHFAGQNLWFYALTVLPLAQVFALEFTSPLWVILLSPVFLGERLTARGLLAGLIGFGGVLLVARPEFGNLHPGLIAAAACAVCFAVTSMLTKRLTRSQPVVAILFWLNLMQFAFAAVIVGWNGGIPMPSLALAPWLLVIGVTGLAAHWCLTSALDSAPASVVMPLDFARLPVIAVVGWAAYREPLDPLVFVGAALILAGNLLTLRRNDRRTEPPRTRRAVAD
ncbi:membrane protein [Rubellimicrobium mesophilum DSM 19309]|uniref:Membrane protein n=2 Tax=Rubellimicrobium TaxID=295418 RepID=A0A017HGW6_9RHOB|nr:DMT family transporter [Rubellimicrobium mesophilum]EYD73571.1 membrane protein [Rubellimicrobium mesophilum DSM 19309]